MSIINDTTLVALELSNSLWLVGTRTPGAQRSRMHRIKAGDTSALLCLFSELRLRSSTKTGPIACCFEAGRDGFWLYRLLTTHGIKTYVVESTSILVHRRAKRAKTDRLDAEGLLRVLSSYILGDTQACSMVRVPTPEEEDGKRLHLEREYLVQGRTRIENRMLALLATQGVRARPSLRSRDRDIALLKTGDGREFPPLLATELNRLKQQLVLTMDMIVSWRHSEKPCSSRRPTRLRSK